MNKRVVITGLGVVSPNGVGKEAFTAALKKGSSGIRKDSQLEALKFSCQVSGTPQISTPTLEKRFTELELSKLNSSGILYGVVAGMEAWEDARLDIPEDEPDWDSGTIFGTGNSGVDKLREAIYKVDDLKVRRLGSSVVEQVMASGISAYLGGKLGLGNIVTTNSSACITGTESILMAYERIRAGQAKRILAGSTSDSGPYIWGGFDAMRVCPYKFNDSPEKASRPMSATAAGFVPGSGAGALVLESLESALERNATIYAEVLGGHINAGGQRGQGSMTAPNSLGVKRCIEEAIKQAGIYPSAIDAINGHLTATTKDTDEIKNWIAATKRQGNDFPYINSLKSMIGHCLPAAGSIESVATILQLKEGFIFPNLNCEDLHPDIETLIDKSKVVTQTMERELNIIAKANFGFGDVNCCVIFKKY